MKELEFGLEFGKIICISVGYFTLKGQKQFRVTTFHGDEDKILQDFANLINNHYSLPVHCCVVIMLKNLIFLISLEGCLLTELRCLIN